MRQSAGFTVSAPCVLCFHVSLRHSCCKQARQSEAYSPDYPGTLRHEVLCSLVACGRAHRPDATGQSMRMAWCHMPRGGCRSLFRRSALSSSTKRRRRTATARPSTRREPTACRLKRSCLMRACSSFLVCLTDQQPVSCTHASALLRLRLLACMAWRV